MKENLIFYFSLVFVIYVFRGIVIFLGKWEYRGIKSVVFLVVDWFCGRGYVFLFF